MIAHSRKHVHVPLQELPVQLRVRIGQQTLTVLVRGKENEVYPVSTSKFGPGFEENSHKTPLGRFVIAEKIGDQAPPGTVFKGRLPTGETAERGGEDDLILTRILWLDGLDPENANTKSRYIYIHGTNQESRLGSPCSHGCIRMGTRDLIALFDRVPIGTIVEITE